MYLVGVSQTVLSDRLDAESVVERGLALSAALRWLSTSKTPPTQFIHLSTTHKATVHAYGYCCCLHQVNHTYPRAPPLDTCSHLALLQSAFNAPLDIAAPRFSETGQLIDPCCADRYHSNLPGTFLPTMVRMI